MRESAYGAVDFTPDESRLPDRRLFSLDLQLCLQCYTAPARVLENPTKPDVDTMDSSKKIGDNVRRSRWIFHSWFSDYLGECDFEDCSQSRAGEMAVVEA